jgi:hypothetical protein
MLNAARRRAPSLFCHSHMVRDNADTSNSYLPAVPYRANLHVDRDGALRVDEPLDHSCR